MLLRVFLITALVLAIVQAGFGGFDRAARAQPTRGQHSAASAREAPPELTAMLDELLRKKWPIRTSLARPWPW